MLLVSGVFLGIQVANWNLARADRTEYEAALLRLGAEIDTNLASLDAFDACINIETIASQKANKGDPESFGHFDGWLALVMR